MKHLLPVLVFLLLAVSVFAIFKYKTMMSNVAPLTAEQVASVDKVPTGDPDDMVDVIVESAVAEAGDSSAEDAELDDVSTDLTEASSLGDVYSENEY